MKNKWTVFHIKTWHLGIAFVALVLLTNFIAHRELNTEINKEFHLADLNDVTIKNTEIGTNYILFYTEDSKPCNIMEQNLRHIEQTIADTTSTKFLKADINKYPELYNNHKITGVPCVLILKDGKETNRIVGVVSTSNLKFIYKKTAR